MSESTPKPPLRSEEKKTPSATLQELEPFDRLRRQVDRLFDEFHHSFPRLPFGRSLFDAEHILATCHELGRRDRRSLKGEKKAEKEERRKDYYLSERRYGSFQRTAPESVDAEKVQASFKKGVLTITLPKTTESLKKEKKITIASG